MMHQHNFNPALRGFNAVFRPNERNDCPGCGRCHWDVRSTTAECAFCATALPIIGETTTGRAATVLQRRHIESAARGRFTINGRP